jgi:phage FluMu protein Com
MQIRCSHCHRPFALSRDEVVQALDTISVESMSHYNAHCPHCGRVNRISQQELRRSAPDWQKKPAPDQS